MENGKRKKLLELLELKECIYFATAKPLRCIYFTTAKPLK